MFQPNMNAIEATQRDSILWDLVASRRYSRMFQTNNDAVEGVQLDSIRWDLVASPKYDGMFLYSGGLEGWT